MRLTNDCINTFVSVPNIFIDKYMTNANGEFVKVYLYLLRCMQSGLDASISTIADYCALTENDIVRALIYWNNANVLALEIEEKKISGIRFLDLNASNQKKTELPKDSSPISVSASISTDTTTEAVPTHTFSEASPISGNAIQTKILERTQVLETVAQNTITEKTKLTESKTELPSANTFIETTTTLQNTVVDAEFTQVSKNTMQETAVLPPSHKNYTPKDIKAFRSNPDISELLFVLETYIKRTLKPFEMDSVFFWMEELKFSKELAEYLIESCVAEKHINISYMEKIAMDWAKEGISTIEQAKHYTITHSKAYCAIIKAFGIRGRDLGEVELAFLNKWTKVYGFNHEIIQEACNRTLSNIQQPKFEYTDSILTSWNKQNLRTLQEIATTDTTYKKTKKSSSTKNSTAKSHNSFNDFPQETYDYDELEELLLITSM